MCSFWAFFCSCDLKSTYCVFCYLEVIKLWSLGGSVGFCLDLWDHTTGWFKKKKKHIWKVYFKIKKVTLRLCRCEMCKNGETQNSANGHSFLNGDRNVARDTPTFMRVFEIKCCSPFLQPIDQMHTCLPWFTTCKDGVEVVRWPAIPWTHFIHCLLCATTILERSVFLLCFNNRIIIFERVHEYAL